MSGCTNCEIGALLYGYEINILTEEESRQFERHLLECEHCYDELKSFEKEATVLYNDTEIRALSAKATEKEITKQSFWGKIRQYFWPDVPMGCSPQGNALESSPTAHRLR